MAEALTNDSSKASGSVMMKSLLMSMRGRGWGGNARIKERKDKLQIAIIEFKVWQKQGQHINNDHCNIYKRTLFTFTIKTQMSQTFKVSNICLQLT